LKAAKHHSGSPSHLGIAGFIISNGPFFHTQRNVSVHITEELSPNVREIPFLAREYWQAILGLFVLEVLEQWNYVH
jgi:hypothetical protein